MKSRYCSTVIPATCAWAKSPASTSGLNVRVTVITASVLQCTPALGCAGSCRPGLPDFPDRDLVGCLQVRRGFRNSYVNTATVPLKGAALNVDASFNTVRYQPRRFPAAGFTPPSGIVRLSSTYFLARTTSSLNTRASKSDLAPAFVIIKGEAVLMFL